MVVKGGGGRGSRSRFTENKIGISRFTEKGRTFFFKQKLHTVSFWKITSKAKPCLLFSLSVHFAFCAMQKKISDIALMRFRHYGRNRRNRGWKWWLTKGHWTVHGSRRIKHLFLVSRKIILQNHASRLLWKSRFTRKKLAISHFTGKKKGPSRVTKIPFTTLKVEKRTLKFSFILFVHVCTYHFSRF